MFLSSFRNIAALQFTRDMKRKSLTISQPSPNLKLHFIGTDCEPTVPLNMAAYFTSNSSLAQIENLFGADFQKLLHHVIHPPPPKRKSINRMRPPFCHFIWRRKMPVLQEARKILWHSGYAMRRRTQSISLVRTKDSGLKHDISRTYYAYFQVILHTRL
jgi:hypothetical protein